MHVINVSELKGVRRIWKLRWAPLEWTGQLIHGTVHATLHCTHHELGTVTDACVYNMRCSTTALADLPKLATQSYLTPPCSWASLLARVSARPDAHALASCSQRRRHSNQISQMEIKRCHTLQKGKRWHSVLHTPIRSTPICQKCVHHHAMPWYLLLTRHHLTIYIHIHNIVVTSTSLISH